TTIVLSDILNNHALIFSGYVNGRITESQILAAYLNQKNRLNWLTGISQDPYFFLEPSEIVVGPTPGENTLVTNIRRLVIRSAFGQAYYPFSRFSRVEGGLRIANVDDSRLSILEPFDPNTGFATREATLEERNLDNVSYVQPSVALVHDNTIFGYTGPLLGRRSRFELAQTVGGWTFTQGTADYRRYDHLFGPFTFATRALYFGRIGPDARQFQVFLGSTDLLRGNTSGSYTRNECLNSNDSNTQTGCVELDRLVGTQIAVASAELRFPLLNASLGFIPLGFPPIEGALFYDVGLAWNNDSEIKFSRDPGDDPVNVRTPLQTIGASIRANVLGIVILRLDWSNPLNRPGVGSLWTLSLGPTF
ncbi:MAG: BamA/TamA family outer membrane protein, partial [Gemmatimonadales bacterium]